MANFMQSMKGEGGIAKMAGQKAGELVEGTVNKVMSGKGEKKAQEGEQVKEGGQGAGGEQEKGGFGLEDALSMAGGKKNEKGGKNLFGGILG